MLGFLSTRPSLSLVASSGAILLFGFVLFSFISKKGKQLLLKQEGTALKQLVQQPLKVGISMEGQEDKLKQDVLV
jgi:hypothetical protein